MRLILPSLPNLRKQPNRHTLAPVRRTGYDTIEALQSVPDAASPRRPTCFHHDDEADLDPLKEPPVAAIGYDTPGFARALKLRDSGLHGREA